jgi:hypothetical protein
MPCSLIVLKFIFSRTANQLKEVFHTVSLLEVDISLKLFLVNECS